MPLGGQGEGFDRSRPAQIHDLEAGGAQVVGDHGHREVVQLVGWGSQHDEAALAAST